MIRLGLAGTVMRLLVGLLALPSAAETAEGEQGRLSVASSPEVDTQIRVDGYVRNTARVDGLRLDAGANEVCAAPVAGYQEVACQHVAVTAGQVERVVFEFEPVQDDTREPEPEPEPTVRTNVELTGSAASARGPNWIARVATLVTEAGEPSSGVMVSGVWDLGGSRSTCTTDHSGGCTLALDGLHNRDKDVTFTVDRLDGATFDGPSVAIGR